jgi:cell division protein FtsQ
MERSLAPRLPLVHRPRPNVHWRPRGRLAALGARLRQRRRARIGLICAALALALLGGGWLWLRGSSLVAIERVQLIGVRGPEHAAVERALEGAARRMTTLNLDQAALAQAVAAYPVVRSLSASARFPHGVSIKVQEQLPVAALQSGSWRSAVAADGVVLGPALLAPDLPLIGYSPRPAAGRTVSAAGVRAMLAVIAAAPAALARKVAKVAQGSQGLTLSMRNGLDVYFGDATRAPAKWLALVRVLADPSSAGASYVDVRLPARAAAGFPAGSAAAAASSATSAGGEAAAGAEEAKTQQLGGSETTIQALAEALRNESARDGGVPLQGASTSTPSGAEAEATAAAQQAQAPAGEQPTEAASTPSG